METHFLDTDDYKFTSEDKEVIRRVANDASELFRSHLPQLPVSLHLLVEPGASVIDVTGELGFALAPHAIRWTVDPSRGVGDTASTHLLHSLVHESHHAARLGIFPSEAYTHDWPGGAVFEGLATAFERDVGGFDAPWGQYDLSTIGEWAAELFAQPIDDTYAQWKFNHPDGRRWIAYRVGTWIVDRACDRTGNTPATLVGRSATEIVEMAETS